MEEKYIKTVPLFILVLIVFATVISSIFIIVNLSNLDIIPTFSSQKLIKEFISDVNVESNENLLAYKMLKIDEGYILISNKFNNSKKYYIEKYDENFSLILSKELKIGIYNELYIANFVENEKGIYILGSAIEEENKKYAMIIKIDSNLNILFSDVSNEEDVFVYGNILKCENERMYLSGAKVHKKEKDSTISDTQKVIEDVKFDLIVAEYSDYGSLIQTNVVKDDTYSYGYLATNTIILKDKKYLSYAYEKYGKENVIIKTDENLNLVWENKIETMLGYSNTYVEDIVEDENSNIYAVIRYDKENSDECKIFIRKINKDGITLWQKEIRITNAKSKVTSISCNNGIYIQSCTDKYNTQNESNVLKPVLLKYDYDGNYIWNVTIKDDIKYDTGIFYSLIENEKLKIFLVNGVVGSGVFKSTTQDNYNFTMYEYNYKIK